MGRERDTKFGVWAGHRVDMITMRTKSPWGLHVPSVETQMMPAFSWVQQTVVLSSKITFESLACDPW